MIGIAIINPITKKISGVKTDERSNGKEKTICRGQMIETNLMNSIENLKWVGSTNHKLIPYDIYLNDKVPEYEQYWAVSWGNPVFRVYASSFESADKRAQYIIDSWIQDEQTARFDRYMIIGYFVMVAFLATVVLLG